MDTEPTPTGDRLNATALTTVSDELGPAFESALPQFVVDRPSLQVLAVNRAALAFYGYAKGQFVGMSMLELQPAGEREQAGNALERQTSGKATGTCSHLRADGETCSVRLVLTELTCQARPAVLVQVIDVTEEVGARRRLDEAVAAAERRSDGNREQPVLDALMRHIPEGITIARAPDVVIERVSAHGIALTQRPPDAVEGMSALARPTGWRILRSDGVTPATSDELPLNRATLHGEVVLNEEFVLERADGSRITLLCNAGPIRDGDRITGGLSAFRDITDRKRGEVERSRLLDEARAAIEEKTQALRVLSHELRQPLTGIIAAAYVIEQPIVQPDQMRRAAAVIKRQVAHLTRFADDLFDIVRLEKGTITIHRTALDLGLLIAELAATVRGTFDGQGVALRLQIAEPSPHISGDATRVTQIFSNLLDNAAKFTAAGGQVSVSVALEGGEAVVRVADTGAGISPDLRPRVFEMFARGAEGSGLGIGLAVVQKLTQLHGGVVSAHSDGPGRGSEFVVRFPALP